MAGSGDIIKAILSRLTAIRDARIARSLERKATDTFYKGGDFDPGVTGGSGVSRDIMTGGGPKPGSAADLARRPGVEGMGASEAGASSPIPEPGNLNWSRPANANKPLQIETDPHTQAVIDQQWADMVRKSRQPTLDVIPGSKKADGGPIDAAMRLARQTGGLVPGIPDAPPLGTQDILHHVSPFGHAIHTHAADLFNNYIAGNSGGGGGGSPLDVAAIVAASPVGPPLPGSGGTGGTGGGGGGGGGSGGGGAARGGAIEMAGGGDVIKALLRRLGMRKPPSSATVLDEYGYPEGSYRAPKPWTPEFVGPQEPNMTWKGSPQVKPEPKSPLGDAVSRAEATSKERGGYADGGAIDAALRMARQAGGRAPEIVDAPSSLELLKQLGRGVYDVAGPPIPKWPSSKQEDLEQINEPSFGDTALKALSVPGAFGGIGALAKKAAPYAAGAGLGMLGAPSNAGEPTLPPDAEIAKLQAEIAKHQQSIANTIKDIAGTKFRGIGEEAGMARQKALEEATRPYNDAIAQAQSRIAQIRSAGDEEKNALTRIERDANEMRKQESARGKPFNQTPVGEQWEKLGVLAPGIAGLGAAALGRLGHGAKVGWKLPIAEGTAAGAFAANGPLGWDAFFSPNRNPDRVGYEKYGQELKLAQHPRAQEWLDYAKTLPEVNPVRENAQKEFFDPQKAAERMAFGAGEGVLGAGMGLAGAIGLQRLGAGVKSAYESLRGGSKGPSTPPPSGEGPPPQGSLGTAKAEATPPPASPQNKTPPSASPSEPPETKVTPKRVRKEKTPRQEAESYFKKPSKNKASSPGDQDYPFTPDDKFQRGGVIGQALKYATGGVVHAGPIQHAADGGRTDTVPLDVAPGSYVIPADIISGIGQGDTTAGYRALEGMFGPQGPKPAQGAGGPPVPILAAGGEFVISPEVVGKVGKGDLKAGHEALDLWVKMQRRKIIQELSKLPGPAKD